MSHADIFFRAPRKSRTHKWYGGYVSDLLVKYTYLLLLANRFRKPTRTEMSEIRWWHKFQCQQTREIFFILKFHRQSWRCYAVKDRHNIRLHMFLWYSKLPLRFFFTLPSCVLRTFKSYFPGKQLLDRGLAYLCTFLGEKFLDCIVGVQLLLAKLTSWAAQMKIILEIFEFLFYTHT